MSERDSRTRPRTSRHDPFGPLLPDVTSDEQAAAWGERDERDPDEHLWRDVPPHHG